MKVQMHVKPDGKIAEITSDGLVINNVEDGIDLMGNLYYQEVEKIILYEKNITPAFFDLKTKIAGEILQKFSTYRMRLAIIGDFNHIKSKSLKDFIIESNRQGRINFVGTLDEALGN